MTEGELQFATVFTVTGSKNVELLWYRVSAGVQSAAGMMYVFRQPRSDFHSGSLYKKPAKRISPLAFLDY